jgi:hypothetical protein
MDALSEKIFQRFSGDRKTLDILLNLADSYQERPVEFSQSTYPTPPVDLQVLAIASEDTYGQRLKSVQLMPEVDPAGWAVALYVLPAAGGPPQVASAVTRLNAGPTVTTVTSTYTDPIEVNDTVFMMASFWGVVSGDLVGMARTKFEPPRPV